MNPKQQREVEILSRLEAGALDAGTAGQLLGVGTRQIRRLRARFRREGLAVFVNRKRAHLIIENGPTLMSKAPSRPAP